MKAFLSACVVAIVLAIGCAYVLNAYQESVSVAYTTSAVRT